MNKRVLVTGANGQLGKTINELFAKNEYGLEFTFVTKAELDIAKEADLKPFFKNNKFDYCINCAAYTNVEQAEKTPKIAYKVNAEGVKYLAEACKETDTVLIHISTDYVFDGEKTEPYTTEDKPNPINEYGKSKLLGEQHIQDILEDYFVIRTSWLYSKTYGNNFYKTILKKAKAGEVLLITDDQIGCPTNTENLAKHIMSLIASKSKDYGIRHFCDEKEMTWYDFAKNILKEHLYEHIKLVKAKNYRTFARRPKYSVFNKSIEMKKKNLIVFGTRPEAIKMAPLVKEFLRRQDKFETKVCITAQHREMLDQVLDFFEITPDFDLDLMKPNQNLYTLTADIITGLKTVLEDFDPDYVYVHGDTTTTMAASIAAFYSGAKVCHVEAGLRTFNKQSPFPEEMNRSVTGRVTDFHFSPTPTSKANLIRENVDEKTILITGNTVIDALNFSTNKVSLPQFKDEEVDYLKTIVDSSKKLILVTGHRRENHGQGFINICKALKKIAEENKEVQIIYPVHLNPNVQKPVYKLLDGVSSIKLINPLSYPAFVWLMNQSYIIITDSGGVQEEAPSLGKPVIVMRDTTERPEAVDAGTVLLVGTNAEKIVNETNKLLTNKEFYNSMSMLHNPYGDGTACEKIVDFINSI